MYVTINEAIKGILQLGWVTLLAKIDIRSAFRLLPVHSADRHMLGMHWKDDVYTDTCLPFGLYLAPKLFNILTEFLSWIAKESNLSFLIHYLDNFLTMGRTTFFLMLPTQSGYNYPTLQPFRYPTCLGKD